MTFQQQTKLLLKKWATTRDDTALRAATKGLPVGSYILQPAGTQGFPDVLVKVKLYELRFAAVAPLTLTLEPDIAIQDCEGVNMIATPQL